MEKNTDKSSIENQSRLGSAGLVGIELNTGNDLISSISKIEGESTYEGDTDYRCYGGTRSSWPNCIL